MKRSPPNPPDETNENNYPWKHPKKPWKNEGFFNPQFIWVITPLKMKETWVLRDSQVIQVVIQSTFSPSCWLKRGQLTIPKVTNSSSKISTTNEAAVRNMDLTHMIHHMYIYIYTLYMYIYIMGVSKNNGTPKSSI